MKKTLIILAAASMVVASCKKKGCMDPIATNYSAEAEKDDGSCTYDGDVINGDLTEDITTNTIIPAGITNVCGTIDVSAELEISPGATLVMCSESAFNVTATGSISAIGTATQPIVFKGETEAAGFWNGIAIRSNNPLNQFDYVTVKDGGAYWGYEDATVFVDASAQLGIQNSTVSNSVDNGLFVDGGATLSNFANNTFSNNVTGLVLDAANVDVLDLNSDYLTGNSNAFIYVLPSDVSTASTWSKLSAPLLLHGLTVTDGLTLSPGIEIMCEAQDGIKVETTGFLNAEGTATENITIKGRYATAAYWSGIQIASNNPNNVFEYVNVTDGGSYWGYSYSNIQLNAGSLVIDNCSVSNANSWGLYINSSSSVTSGGTVQTVAANVESNNTFSSNGAGPDASCTGGCGVFFE